jgi:hypothetical protein
MQDDKSHMAQTSSPLTRAEIEDWRAMLKIHFANKSQERHIFNRICDQAVRALKVSDVGSAGVHGLDEHDEPLREMCIDYRTAHPYHAENYFQRIVRWVKTQSARSAIVTTVDEADRVFNCGGCGAHDFGLNRPVCPHCGYDERVTTARRAEDK